MDKLLNSFSSINRNRSTIFKGSKVQGFKGFFGLKRCND